jgi:hypothetical protein
MMVSGCKSKMMPLRIIEIYGGGQSTGDDGKQQDKGMRSEPQPVTTTRNVESQRNATN